MTAFDFVRRTTQLGDRGLTLQVLAGAQDWAARVLESHRSNKLVALYRSQRGNEPWLAVLTTLLDASALWMTLPRGGPQQGATETFGVARRVVQDLAGIFRLKPGPPAADRLPHARFQELCRLLSAAGMELSDSAETERKLAEVRRTYEPYAYVLSQFLFVELPAWIE